MQLTLIIAAVSAVLSFGLGFGAAWQLQSANITERELNHANERLAVQTSIATALEANQRQIAQAQADSAARGIRDRAAADRSRNAGNGLRIATDTAVRTATEDPATCPDTASALGAVLTASVSNYRELAEICDRHVSDIQTLTGTWQQ